MTTPIESFTLFQEPPLVFHTRDRQRLEMFKGKNGPALATAIAVLRALDIQLIAKPSDVSIGLKAPTSTLKKGRSTASALPGFNRSPPRSMCP
jgi:hypothetical protein